MTPFELIEAQRLVDILPLHARRLAIVKAGDVPMGDFCHVAGEYDFGDAMVRACRPLMVAEIEERITAAKRRLRQLGVTLP